MLNSAPDKRQFKDFSTEDILDLSESTVFISELELLVYELQFRSPKSSDVKHRKAEVYLKLLTLLNSKRGVSNTCEEAGPERVVPIKRVISRENRNNFKKFKGFEWREVGVLKASGYSVGVSNPTHKNERYKILDSLVLIDDLLDVSDRAYAAEYDLPNTQERLSKIVNSISFFIVNASRVTTRDNSKAINDWKEDLGYLKSNYQRAWPEFYWPKI